LISTFFSGGETFAVVDPDESGIILSGAIDESLTVGFSDFTTTTSFGFVEISSFVIRRSRRCFSLSARA